MRSLVLLACLIFHVYGVELDSSEYGVAATTIKPNCSCGWTNKGEKQPVDAVNGRAASPFKYPMMAAIITQKENSVVCGGTIITNKHIISCANCTLTLNPRHHWIVVGTNNYESRSKTIYRIIEIIQHPDYMKTSQHQQFLSIVISDTEFEMGPNVGPACMPTKSVDLTAEKLVSLGWRNLWFKGKDNAYVLETYARSRLLEECDLEGIKDMDKDKQLCTYCRTTFSCQRESAGGPLLWLNPETNRYTLVGAQTEGVHCQRFSTVVSVSYFIPWINEIIAATGPSTLTCSAPE